jgi:hypothetical protein
MAKVPLFNPNDGLVGRDGGPYADVESARHDETRRARVEGREPDYDNPGPNAGIPLVTAAQLIHNLNVQGGSRSRVNPLGLSPNVLNKVVEESQAELDEGDEGGLVETQVTGEIDTDLVASMVKEAADKELSGEDFHPDDPNAPVGDVEAQSSVGNESNSDEVASPETKADAAGSTSDSELFGDSTNK